MKKIVSLLLALVMLASVVTVMSSCEFIPGGDSNNEHTHAFSDKWSSNEKEHWHAARCEHKDERDSVKGHYDGDYDGICDTCSYVMEEDDNNQGEVESVVTYIVDVKDASGKAVEGVKVILISDKGYTSTMTTNARGRVSFNLVEGDWVAALAEPVEGYSNTVNDRYELDDRKGEIILK